MGLAHSLFKTGSGTGALESFAKSAECNQCPHHALLLARLNVCHYSRKQSASPEVRRRGQRHDTTTRAGQELTPASSRGSLCEQWLSAPTPSACWHRAPACQWTEKLHDRATLAGRVLTGPTVAQGSTTPAVCRGRAVSPLWWRPACQSQCSRYCACRRHSKTHLPSLKFDASESMFHSMRTTFLK